MNAGATRFILSVIAILLTIGLSLAKSIGSPSDSDAYQRNQVEARDDLTLDNALLKYILAREVLNRQRSEEYPLQKRDYWKQCAFNAVSCFGKK